MTLNTRIIIVEPLSVKELFRECQRVIGSENAIVEEDQSSTFTPGQSNIRNKAGQGFPAWLWLNYGADAPLRPDPEYADAPDERRYMAPAGVDEWTFEIHYDTAYGYDGPGGGGCADLHAWIITQLAPWLNERRLTWYWYQEFTGEWYSQHDPVTNLGDPEMGNPHVLEEVA